MRVSTFFGILFLFVGFTSPAQDFSRYEKNTFIAGKDTLLYRILLPEGYKSTKKYPLVVFLHGSGERGNDNEAQLKHGGSLFMQDSIRKNIRPLWFSPMPRRRSVDNHRRSLGQHGRAASSSFSEWREQ